MNSDWFGDSYDIVKRHFVTALRTLGYQVYVDPMATGDWSAAEPAFLAFLGAQHVGEWQSSVESALLLDPDTGVGARASSKHTTIPQIVSHLKHHTIVFVFDQSFSRGSAGLRQLLEKLRQVEASGAHAFYYDSHARFLFASLSAPKLNAFRTALEMAGLPAHRLVGTATTGS